MVPSLNKGSMAVIALPYFSSAFDKMDHSIFLHRFHTDLGFTDIVLKWFSSYLTDLTQLTHISLSNHCFVSTPVHQGALQCSAPFPILFSMYVKHLPRIIYSHSTKHQSFDDYLQILMCAPPDKTSKLRHSMQSCISGVKSWATTNMLKLDNNKTELMLVISIRTKHLHNRLSSITIGNAQIAFKQSVIQFEHCAELSFY